MRRPAMITPFVPEITLCGITGSTFVATCRASSQRNHWNPPDELVRDAISGGQLTIAGAMTTFTAAGTVTARSRRLLERAGFRLPERIETHLGAEDFQRRLNEVSRPRATVIQHVLADDELPLDRYSVPRDVLSRINNKGRLEELAPAGSTPSRRVLARRAIHAAPPDPPVVIKVASDDSSGGGFGIAVCRTSDDVARALERLRHAEYLVCEEYLDYDRNQCLHFAIALDGSVKYLGAAEQVSRADGSFFGNWLDGSIAADEAVVPALETARAIASLGYHGFLGLDVLTTSAGPRIVDVNARLNGSTVARIYFDQVRDLTGAQAVRVLRWPVDEREWEATLERLIDERRLLPTCIYDPEGGPHASRSPFIITMILGRDREEIESWMSQAMPRR